MAREPNTRETAQAEPLESAGVDDLIGRLRDQGIAQGRSEADALVADAQRRAADLVSAAKKEADAHLEQARRDAGKLKAAGEDAVRLAMRDAILSLEGDLLRAFVERLRHLVRGVLAEPAFLERMIVAVAGRTAPAIDGKSAEIVLPSEVVSLEDLRRKPESAKPGTLMHFVLSMGGGMLREGMTFGVSDDGEAGIRVRLVGEDVQVDLTEGAISELLLRHLVPRFRALLRGAVVAESAAARAGGSTTGTA
ncbi:MAG TPA: hypothetical protein VFD92_17885 [Candidatus Binatia bacterium]|nr:hypothetical protein [Candidatus Binatia bacterium]